MNSISLPPIALATLPGHLSEHDESRPNSSIPANAAQSSQPYVLPTLASEQMDTGLNQHHLPAVAPGNLTPPDYSTGSATQVSLEKKDREPWI